MSLVPQYREELLCLVSAAREGLDTQMDLLMLHTDVHILCKASFRKGWGGVGGGDKMHR